MKGRNRGTKNRTVSPSKQTKATWLQSVARSEITLYFGEFLLLIRYILQEVYVDLNIIQIFPSRGDVLLFEILIS